MANIRRHTAEAASILGFLIAAWYVPQSELKWFSIGAATTALACILLYEIALTRKERELFALRTNAESALAEKNNKIKELNERIEAMADPELMAIYRDDERERLRIEREAPCEEIFCLKEFMGRLARIVQTDDRRVL